MKRRTGFVSNSSSSSFIIGLGVLKTDEIVKDIKCATVFKLADVVSNENTDYRMHNLTYNERSDEIVFTEPVTYNNYYISHVSRLIKYNPNVLGVLVDFVMDNDAIYDEESDEYYDPEDFDIDAFTTEQINEVELISKHADICFDEFETRNG